MRIEQIISLGVLVILIGFTIVFIGTFLGSKDANTRTKVAVGGIIGPIPFGFGNDKNLLWFSIGISVIAFIVFLFFNYRIK